MERTAIFPGSFNPFTVGHKSIVDRALPLFDKIVIAVGYNEHKAGAADVGEARCDTHGLFRQSEDRSPFLFGADRQVCRGNRRAVHPQRHKELSGFRV